MMKNSTERGQTLHGGSVPGGRKQKGFTLLEVLVALAITGMALGGLFSVIAGNKQLAWRSEEALIEATRARNLINYSQLNDTRGTVFIEFQDDNLLLSSGGEFDPPDRKTMPSPFALRSYEVVDENGDVVAQGSYWVELDFPE